MGVQILTKLNSKGITVENPEKRSKFVANIMIVVTLMTVLSLLIVIVVEKAAGKIVHASFILATANWEALFCAGIFAIMIAFAIKILMPSIYMIILALKSPLVKIVKN